jgi:ABC-type lipoprotein release transport system permease subunit
MGIVASVLGWLIGFISIILIAGFTRGWDIVANIEVARVFTTLGWAIAVGLALTIAATIFPAMRAAGMPAANALRSEI